jgi:Carboxypeptidase regulatory-like domain
MRFCSTCGAYYAASMFCLRDGTPLTEVPQGTDHWNKGARRLEAERQVQAKRARRIKLRRLMMATVAMLVLARIAYVVVVKSVEHAQTDPDKKSSITTPTPSPSSDPSPSPGPSPSSSPSPSPGPTASPSPSPSPSPPLLFVISGRISYATGKLPFALQVRLSGKKSATLMTDTDGNYRFEGLASGDYTVTPVEERLNFEPASRDLRNLTRNQQADFRAAPKLYKISGQIRGPAGALPSVRIRLEGATSATTSTDGNGNYSFERLPAGDYTVTPTNDKMSFAPRSRVINKLERDERADFSATETPQLHSISGQVRTPDAKLPAVFEIRLSGAKSSTTMTDAGGNYRFVNLPSGDYTVTAVNARMTFDPPRRDFHNLSRDERADFSVRSVPMFFKISGRVKSLLGRPPQVRLRLTGTTSATTTTDANGAYSFEGLPAGGRYTIAADSPDATLIPPARTVAALNKDEQVNFNVLPITISNEKLYKITGFVDYQRAAVPFGIQIHIKLEGAKSQVTKVNADGHYSFTGLPAGRYTVTPLSDGMTFRPSSSTVTLSADTTINFVGVIGRP